MVSLSLMVQLVEAVSDDAQLVLVGDPDQLAAIEVGAVLRDIVGPAAEAPQFGPGMRAALERVTGETLAGPEQRSFGDGVAVLRRGTAASPPIGALAEAIRRGDEDATVAALASGDGSITWLRDPLADPGVLRDHAIAAYGPMIAAARAGDAKAALDQLGASACCARTVTGRSASRNGPTRSRGGCATAVPGFEPGAQRYPGLPLLVTRNDYELRLHNGDTGVVVSGADGELRAVFDAGGARSSSRRRGWPTSSRCSRRPSTRARALSSTWQRCCCRSRTRRCSRANCSTRR